MVETDSVSGRFANKLEQDADLPVFWVRAVRETPTSPSGDIFADDVQRGILLELEGEPTGLEGFEVLEASFAAEYGLIRIALGDREPVVALYVPAPYRNTTLLLRAAISRRFWVGAATGVIQVPLSPEAAAQLSGATRAAHCRPARLN